MREPCKQTCGVCGAIGWHQSVNEPTPFEGGVPMSYIWTDDFTRNVGHNFSYCVSHTQDEVWAYAKKKHDEMAKEREKWQTKK